MTLDHVTGGRYILGLGAGWHVGEHESFGIDLPPLGERFDRFEATIRVLEALFSDEARAAPGRDARCAAVPARWGHRWSPVPSGRAVRRSGSVARDRAACASRRATPTAGTTPRTWTGRSTGSWSGATRSARACEAIGRDPAELTLSAQIIIPRRRRAGRRTAFDAPIAYGRAGASEILLTTPAREGAAGIRRLATEVAAPLRDAFG